MNIKTRIKNDLWRWNYILPFVKKYQFDEKGKASFLKHVFQAYKDIKPIKASRKIRTVGNDIHAILDSVDVDISDENQFIYFIDVKKTIAVPGNILSNFPLAYDKIIHGTFEELVKLGRGDDGYGQEIERVAKGIERLIERILDEIPKSGFPKAIEGHRIHDFQRMLYKPAEHFDEALQRILFFNQIMWQTRHRLNGLGRLDLILNDLYENDIYKAYLTKDLASQMVRDFLSQLSKYSEYKSDALVGDIGQIIVLGGLEIDGTYFCNEVTEIFLKEQAKLGKPDPKTFLRVSQKMPKEILKVAVECLSSKTGSPLFSNDDVVIPALLDFGIVDIDAYQYCASACWEPFIVGRSLDQNNIAVYDFFTALNEVLNEAETIKSYEQLVEKYIKYNETLFQKFLVGISQLKWAKDPLVSMFTDGCSEKRLDISEGAAFYNNYGITTVALSNVVDSLLNIKHIVFDGRECTLADLNKWRNKDYVGHEVLLKSLQKNKYYGHDDADVVELVEDITGSLSKIAENYHNRYGGTVKFGLSSPGYNILCKKSSADISGRRKGMPYNTHISCSDAAYTEIVNFAAQLDYKHQKFNGNVVDFFMAPLFLEKNRDKFILFMSESIKVGFFQMQMNVMDSGTLIDAREHPESYAGLIVRVWGFSAYYNDLPESYKDLLIERALAAERVAGL